MAKSNKVTIELSKPHATMLVAVLTHYTGPSSPIKDMGNMTHIALIKQAVERAQSQANA